MGSASISSGINAACKGCAPAGAHARAVHAAPQSPHWRKCRNPSARRAGNGGPAAGRWQMPPVRRCRRRCCWLLLPPAAGWLSQHYPPELSQRPLPAGCTGARGDSSWAQPRGSDVCRHSGCPGRHGWRRLAPLNRHRATPCAPPGTQPLPTGVRRSAAAAAQRPPAGHRNM